MDNKENLSYRNRNNSESAMEVDQKPDVTPEVVTAPLHFPPNPSVYQVMRTLGEGAFGEVKLVLDQHNPSIGMAMKCIDLREKTEEQIGSFRREALLQRTVSWSNKRKERQCGGHVNVIHYIGMKIDTVNQEFQIFLEYADGGELFDQIEPDIGMPASRAQYFFRQLIAGLEYIHQQGVAHRDIKPENLLLANGGILKISDFGLATLFRHNGRERRLSALCGTLPYASPEVFAGNYRGEPADIWSCGIVLIALLTGELPWDTPNKNNRMLVQWFEGSNMEQKPWCKLTETAIDLLRHILTFQEDTRYTMQQIQEHEWFNYNYESEAKRRRIAEFLLNASQPSPHSAATSTARRLDSFSQPAALDVDSLLIPTSQIEASQLVTDPLQLLVRRMTRFCVSVSPEETVEAIQDAAKTLGYECKEKPPNQMLLTTRDGCFLVSIYIMTEKGSRKIMVDFRRSRGDGLQFKRSFKLMKEHLTHIICREGYNWLETKGLTSQIVV